jgi:hypothetical protein
VHNHRGERLLAVTSVDGVNIISGETAAWDQTGYVFDPYQGYELTGWRKSDAEVAAFTFSAASESYAERTGRPQNVGVIGVALFRERQEVPQGTVNIPVERAPPGPVPAEGGAQAGAAAPPPPPPARSAELARQPLAGQVAEPLGTAHGEREVSYSRTTTFERRQPQPDEVIRIRYDSRENLIALGVIPWRSHPLPRPEPFPDSDPRYVPDPPAG